MDAAEFVRRSAEAFGSRVERIADDQWHNATPCTEWDVTDLVHHLVYECLWLAPMLQGETIKQIGDRFEGDILGADPKAVWRKASQDAVAATAAPEALERAVQLSYGPSSGADYAKEVGTDLLVHAWDLARGIEDDDRLDPELVRLAYDRIEPMIDALSETGMFGTRVPVPDDADLQTKLLGMLGRKR
jgi:uncharacterized protein (TIGR03086 family)